MEAKRDAAQAEVSRMLEELEAEQDRMNDWEKGFVGDIQDVFLAGKRLTTGQLDKLREVYERYF